jgi:hypothetical protein
MARVIDSVNGACNVSTLACIASNFSTIDLMLGASPAGQVAQAIAHHANMVSRRKGCVEKMVMANRSSSLLPIGCCDAGLQFHSIRLSLCHG